MKDRIYVCHTYYHVYVTFLKEFALPKEKQGGATVVLSKMSTDFESLKERLLALHYFEDVIEFDEKRFTEFEELVELHKDRGNILKNMPARIKFTRRYAQLEEPFVPVDFKQYKEVYVFCDSDPIGYYLNYKHIPYHALEDGYNCLKLFDAARVDNRGSFRIKAFLASLNLIFIQNGYSKYCIDMEVNDRSCLQYDYKKYKEVPRKPLEEQLLPEEKRMIVDAFLENADELREALSGGEKKVILLTEKICTDEVRVRLVKDMIQKEAGDARVFIKPHPMDPIDYEKQIEGVTMIRGRFPLEVLKYVDGIHFDKAVTVLTQAIAGMDYADEKVFLGPSFLDAYEEKEKHSYNAVLS